MKRIAAIGISVWIGVVACLAGCLPSFAHSSAKADSSIKCDLRKDLEVGQITDMGCCRHSGNNSSTPANDKKQSPETASCCPLQATLIQKQAAANACAAVVAYLPFLEIHVLFGQVLRSSEDAGSAVWHTGRDTLLETHLLRI